MWFLSSLHSWSAACPGVISPFGMTEHSHRPAIPVQNVVSGVSVTWAVCWEQQLLMCWQSLLAGLVWGITFWHRRTQLLQGVHGMMGSECSTATINNISCSPLSSALGKFCFDPSRWHRDTGSNSCTGTVGIPDLNQIQAWILHPEALL